MPHHVSNVILVYNLKTQLGITTIPCCPPWIARNCSDQYIWSRGATKTGWDARCSIHHILMDTQWRIHWLWSFHHITWLSWQQLGFHQWNCPCYSSKEMCPWLITSKHCRLRGRYLQHNKLHSSTASHWTTFGTGGPFCTSSSFNTCSSFWGSSILWQWSWEQPFA